MRCLVTGGAGFIGSHLVDALIGFGHEVMVLDNMSTGHADNLAHLGGDARVLVIRGDVRVRNDVAAAVRGCGVIFHLAASVSVEKSVLEPEYDASVNVMGTVNVLECARAEGCKKAVFSSSAGIFGPLKFNPITEDHPTEPQSPYGCSKLYAEKLTMAYADMHGISAVALRYFNVYGPRQRDGVYSSAVPIFASQILSGCPMGIFGDGTQTRDFVHVRDIVQANIKAARYAGSGIFNIASGRAVTVNYLAEVMQKTAAHMGLAAEIERKAERKGDIKHSSADISRAAAQLGYAPTVPLEDGVEEYMRWRANSSPVLGDKVRAF